MDGLHCLGVDDAVGFDYGTLLQAAGGLAQGGISAYEDSQAQAKLDADAQKALATVIAADLAASSAAARADVSAQLKSSGAAVDASVAAAASTAQDSAGAGLPSEAAQKRADAADKALAVATTNAKAKPKDGYLKALVKAWTTTVNKAHGGAIVSSDGGGKKGKGKDTGESFWTRHVMGPLPGYAVVVGGVGILGALGFAVKAILRRSA